MGLGDRHGENIMLDQTSGECVHVDFDCLFDKGLSLQVPEIVPFRLTSNMVDAFGVMGYEGVFRGTCEHVLRVLRSESQVLLSVLEAFVHDPLVEWTKEKKKKKKKKVAAPRRNDRGTWQVWRTTTTRTTRTTVMREECCNTSTNVCVVCTIVILS